MATEPTRRKPRTPRGPAAKVYQLNLLENGLDFVRSGIETYFIKDKPDPRAHKYALLHMFSGVVLLLKERLARIKPALVFEDPAQAGQTGAKTTNYHQTLRRLKDNGVTIDPTRLAILGEIRELRNSIEHYEIELTLARTKTVIGELTAFIFLFCEDELHCDMTTNLPERALPRFYALKEIGDRLMADAQASAAADAEADRAYLQSFEDKYAAMSTQELLAFSDAHETDGRKRRRLKCASCSEDTILVFEVGACVNPDCRAIFQLKDCPSCMDVILDCQSYCPLCRGDC